MNRKSVFRRTRILALSMLIFTGTMVASLFPAGPAFTAEEDFNNSVEDLLKGGWGQIKFNLRYRFEHVDQDGLRSAKGDPIRLRLGYQTPQLAGFTGFAEFEGNTPIFEDDYNDTTNGKTAFAVIADPDEAELNQAWLSYTAIPDTLIKGGRQRILLDNQRFIGNVGWRQLEQTFDAVSIFNTTLANFSAKAIFIWNVRSIFSEDVNMQSPLLNLSYTLKDIGSFTGYGYWLDYDDADDSGPFPFAFSTQTYGLRFSGTTSFMEDLFNLLYTAEYANQSDYQDNDQDYTADYFHVIGGVVFPNSNSLLTNITLKVAIEFLGSDSGISFKTPLGTNHAFNGWADKLLTVPPDGLEDFYISLGATIAGAKLDLIYHDYQADSGGDDYGTEFNAALSKKFGKHYTILAKYADYNADDFQTDTEKFWLQFVVAF